MAGGWLIDKSALVRLRFSADGDRWAGRTERGLVWISTLTRLEVGYSARSSADLVSSRSGVSTGRRLFPTS